LPPARRADALGQVASAYQSADRQLFAREHVVLSEQRERRLVVVIGTLALDVLMRLGQQDHRFLAAVAFLLLASDPLLGRLEPLLCAPIVPGMVHGPPRRRPQPPLQPPSKARLASGRGQRR